MYRSDCTIENTATYCANYDCPDKAGCPIYRVVTNDEIAAIEEQIMEITMRVQQFKVDLEYRGRTNANYDHLGTLDVNAKVLRSTLTRLIETLDY